MTEKLGTINNYAGVVISLDQRMMPYFGVGQLQPGEFKVWLSAKRWSVQIPEGLTNEEALQVQKALASGVIREGREYIPPARKDPKTLQHYLNLLKTSYGVTAQSKAPFIALVQKKSEGNHTAIEILNACLKEEESTRHREVWIAFLKDGIKHCDGPLSLVEDYENDPEAYTVTIDPASMVIVEDSRSKTDTKPKAKPKDPTVITDPVAKEKAIKKFLGD